MIRLSRRRIRAILGRGCVAAAISGPWFAETACAQEAVAPPADPGFVTAEPICPPSPPVCGPMPFVAPLEARRETFAERFRSIRRRCSWKCSTTHCNKMYWDASPYWIPNYGYHPTSWRRGACEPGYDPYLPSCPTIGMYAPPVDVIPPAPSQPSDSDYSPKSNPPQEGKSPPPPVELDAPQPKSLPVPRSEAPALPPGASTRKESLKEAATVAVKLDSNPTQPSVPTKEQVTQEAAASVPPKLRGVQGAVLSAVIQPEAEPALASSEVTKQPERPAAEVQRSSFATVGTPAPADKTPSSEKAPVPIAAQPPQTSARSASEESKGRADVKEVAKTPKEKAVQAEPPAVAKTPVASSAGGRELSSSWQPHRESPRADEKATDHSENPGQSPPVQRPVEEDSRTTSVQHSSPPDGKPNWQPHWRPTSRHENSAEIRSATGEGAESRSGDSFTLPGVVSGRTKDDVTNAVKSNPEMGKGCKQPASSESVMRGCVPISGPVAKAADSAGGWRPTGRHESTVARAGIKPDGASGPEAICHRVVASDAIVKNASLSSDASPRASVPAPLRDAAGVAYAAPALYVRRADLVHKQTALAPHEEERSKEALLRLHSSKIPLAPVQSEREAPAVCFVDSEPDIFPLDSRSASVASLNQSNVRKETAVPQARESSSPSSSEAVIRTRDSGTTSAALARASGAEPTASESRTEALQPRRESLVRPRLKAGLSKAPASQESTPTRADSSSAQAPESSDARSGDLTVNESDTSVDRWFTDAEPGVFPLATARPLSRAATTSSGAVQAAYVQQDRVTRAAQASHEAEPRPRGPVYISTHPFVEGERSTTTTSRRQDDEKDVVKP